MRNSLYVSQFVPDTNESLRIKKENIIGSQNVSDKRFKELPEINDPNRPKIIPIPKKVNFNRFSMSLNHEEIYLNSTPKPVKFDKPMEPKKLLFSEPKKVNASLVDFQNQNVIDVLCKIVY